MISTATDGRTRTEPRARRSRRPPQMTSTRLARLAVPIAVVVVVVMMVVPLPAPLLVVLIVAMQVRKPLEFAVFPTVVLVATIFRLALNVSVTRLVLRDGYAGHVI